MLTRKNLAMAFATVVVVVYLVFVPMEAEPASRVAAAYIAFLVGLNARPMSPQLHRRGDDELEHEPPSSRRGVPPVERLVMGAGVYAMADAAAFFVEAMGV